MISKLKKLKGRSLAELVDRCRQKASAMAERAGVSLDVRPVSDAAFLRSFGPDIATGEQLAEYFRERKNGTFYPSFTDKETTISALRKRFPDEESRIIAQADRLCEGKFDLLGYTGLGFGSPVPDWHFEPLSHKRTPLKHWSKIDELDAARSGDKKIVWELNRHQYFTQLGQAYWLTGDERYTKVFLSHIEDWVEKNPPKIGVNWMSSLEAGFRSISWIWAISFFISSPLFRPEIFLKVLKCLYLNGRHLENYLSTYSSPNTHLTGEALGLYFLGTFCEDMDDAARWKEKGYRILLEALDFQVRADGGYVEQATQYHRYTVDFYLSLFIIRRAEGASIDKRHSQKLREMLKFLIYAAQPNGETPLTGDDDGGRLHFLDGGAFADFRSTLAVGAALLGDSELKFAAGRACPEMLWLTGPEGPAAFDSIDPEPPIETARGFEQSGVYSLRDRWAHDANFILIDCGPHGFLNGGHAHADALGFVMSVKGTPIFADSGTYIYTADPKMRDHFRSSGAHNCVTVNGRSSSVMGGPFSWSSVANAELLEWKTDEKGVVFRGTHDGFEKFGVGYEREIRFAFSGETLVIDKIRTKAANSFEVNFILSPGIEAESIGPMSVALRSKAGNHELLAIDTNLGDNPACDGWLIEKTEISPRYGRLVETTKLTLAVTSDQDFQIVNTFRPITA